MSPGRRRARATARTAAISAAAFLILWTGNAGAASHPDLATVVIPNLGTGYAVVSQGPLNAEQFASSSPDPAAAAGALDALSHSITTYQRVWQDAGGANEVQDLVVHFSTIAGAKAFVTAAQHSLASGDIVSSQALPSIAGAMRTTYFASTSQVGVGQAITMRAGTFVALLSIFSASAATNTGPITATDGLTIAMAQHTALVRATPSPGPHHRPAATSDRQLWILVIATLLVVLLVRISLRRARRGGRTVAGTGLSN